MPSSRSRTRNTSVGWSHKAPACAAASHPAAAAPHISRLLGYNNDRWQGENVCFWTLLTNPETVVTKLRWEKLDTTNPPSFHHYQLSRPLHHIPLKQTKNRKKTRLKFHCHSKIQIRSTKNELEYVIKKKIWHTFKLVKCQNALKFHCNSRNTHRQKYMNRNIPNITKKKIWLTSKAGEMPAERLPSQRTGDIISTSTTKLLLLIVLDWPIILILMYSQTVSPIIDQSAVYTPKLYLKNAIIYISQVGGCISEVKSYNKYN